jgi:hypothetical protein
MELHNGAGPSIMDLDVPGGAPRQSPPPQSFNEEEEIERLRRCLMHCDYHHAQLTQGLQELRQTVFRLEKGGRSKRPRKQTDYVGIIIHALASIGHPASSDDLLASIRHQRDHKNLSEKTFRKFLKQARNEGKILLLKESNTYALPEWPESKLG